MLNSKDAAVYKILKDCRLAKDRQGRLLEVKYKGDVARLYCEGQLIADNFTNGIGNALMGLGDCPTKF